MTTAEEEVIIKTKNFLLNKKTKIESHTINSIYTDAHSNLFKYKCLEPFQRITVDFTDFVLYPDLVGQLDDGETTLAVEAKGTSDILKGISQAEMYKYGFHYSFFAAKLEAINSSWIKIIKQKNIGIISVSDEAKMIYCPQASMPIKDIFKPIRRQLDSVAQIKDFNTFTYNIPTHYLVWCVALEANKTYPIGDKKPIEVRSYPLPSRWKEALRGAQKLDLIKIAGSNYELTPVGLAMKTIINTKIEDWSDIHHALKARDKIKLVNCCPNVAAALRIILLTNPFVTLIVNGLNKCPEKTATFPELARICSTIDHHRSMVFFLNPKSLEKNLDKKGRISWEQVNPGDYRSTTFFQFKSILIHAGILNNTGLGGASAKNCDPDKDLWSLFSI